MGTVHLILAALLAVHFVAAQLAPGPEGEGAQPDIIGGEAAEEGQFPFMMRLRMKESDGKYHHCGGTLITSDVVLTAAHCVVEDGKTMSLDKLEVIAGDHSDSAEADEAILDPLRILVHEDYYEDPSGVPVNDLALIRLKGKANFQPISRAEDDSLYEEGTTVTVIGWGVIDADETDADELQYLEYKIANLEDCYKYWQEKLGDEKWKEIIAEGMFCAIDPAEDKGTSGPGDSGGPVIEMKPEDTSSLRLVGVVSWGGDDLNDPTFNMNVNVNYFSDWISSSLNKIESENYWPEIVGDGSHGPVIIYSNDGKKGTICYGGVGERERAMICQELGYKAGIMTSVGNYKGLPHFGYSSMTCSDNEWKDCKFDVYPGKVPCFDGEQLALKCYDQDWDLRVTDMTPTMIPLKGTESRRGRMVVEVVAKKYGVGLEMKDQVQVTLATAKGGGLDPLIADMKYKRKREYYIGKFKKDDEITVDTCFYAIAWVRCTMFYTVGEHGPDDCPSVDNLRADIEKWIKDQNDINCEE